MKRMTKTLAAMRAEAVKQGKSLDWDNWYEATSKQVDQTAAGYSAVGMKDGMACANCNWFISPDSCLLVSGDISPTGLSKFWMKMVPTDSPMAVTVVNDNDEDDAGYSMPLMGKSSEGNFVKAVIDGVKSLFQPTIIEESNEFTAGPMKFFKSAGDGRLRFVTIVSNNFKDRDAETITEAAHKEYVDWATATSTYPELWLWHASNKSRWGQADMLDYVHGFVIASGTVDEGKEFIAKNLAKEGDNVGVSHGFYCVKDGGNITHYRTFEISPLPITAAANEWTGYANFQDLENGLMPFKKDKRDWLVKQGMTPETVTQFENTLAEFAKELKARGVDYKDYDPDAASTTTAVATKATEVVSATAVATTTEQPTVVTTKEIDAINKRFDTLESSVKELSETFVKSIKALSKSEDDKTADFYKSAISKMPSGFRASESDGNTEKTNRVAAELVAEQKQKEHVNWFADIVTAGMRN